MTVLRRRVVSAISISTYTAAAPILILSSIVAAVLVALLLLTAFDLARAAERTLAAGPNAPATVLIRLREKLDPDLWDHTGYLWAEAAETSHVSG